MLNTIFSSVFTETIAAFTFGQFLACTAVSLILGLLIAAVYRYKSECTKMLCCHACSDACDRTDGDHARQWKLLEPESLDYTSVLTISLPGI